MDDDRNTHHIIRGLLDNMHQNAQKLFKCVQCSLASRDPHLKSMCSKSDFH